MPDEKTPNPDSVTLSDIKKMRIREFQIWTFLKLNSIDGKLKEHDRRFDRLSGRLWQIVISVLFLGIVAILAAVL